MSSAPDSNPTATTANQSHHKRTRRVSECDLNAPAAKPKAAEEAEAEEEQEDPVIAKLAKIGCLEKHYQVQDCYFDTKDWRKCTAEVKQFQQCISEAKKNQQQ